MAPVINVTPEALLERRTEILRTLGYEAMEFRKIVESGTLTGDEWLVVGEFEAIEFLLGENSGA